MEDTGRKERLRVLLKEAGLTQDQLAREIGICEKTLRNFMGGGNMGSDSLIHISKRLDASTDFLLGLSKRRHNGAKYESDPSYTIVKYAELSDETIERIAEAVIKRLRDEHTD